MPCSKTRKSIPLVRLPRAKEQMFTTASVLATEEAIAESLEHQFSRTDGPQAEPDELFRAVRETETALGHALTSDGSARRSLPAADPGEERRSC